MALSEYVPLIQNFIQNKSCLAILMSCYRYFYYAEAYLTSYYSRMEVLHLYLSKKWNSAGMTGNLSAGSMIYVSSVLRSLPFYTIP